MTITDSGPNTATGDRGAVPADTFANRLLLARAHAGHLSIREAAERCGLGRGAWQNWEKGARPDDYNALVDLIAERLGVSLDWLRGGGPLTPATTQTAPARWARRNGGLTAWYAEEASRPMISRPPNRMRERGTGPGRTTRTSRAVHR